MNSLATVKLDGGSMDQVGLTAEELIRLRIWIWPLFFNGRWAVLETFDFQVFLERASPAFLTT